MRLLCSIAVVALLILPVSALADTITTSQQSFSLPVGSVPSQIVNFSQFDPSLGTLTGVAIEGTSTISLSGSGTGQGEDDGPPVGLICVYGPLSIRGSVTSGSSTVAVTGTSAILVVTHASSCSSSTPLSNSNTASWGPDGLPGPDGPFVGTGTVPITFSYSFPVAVGGVSSASWSGDADLVYTYTPALPEPSSLLLFGSGALGVIGVLRRKRSVV